MVNGSSLAPKSKRSFLECLIEISRLLGRAQSAASLLSGVPISEERLSSSLLPRAAQNAGLEIDLTERDISALDPATLPCIVVLGEQPDEHGAVLLAIQNGIASVFVPDKGKLEISLDELSAAYSGQCFLVKTIYEIDRAETDYQHKRQHWFWRSLWVSKSIYRDVLIATVMINLFALMSPLFVMNVYDRVVPNNAIDTLWTLVIAAFIVFSFDFIFKLLRSYFLDIAGKKADVILSSTIFEQVLKIKESHKPRSTGSFAKNLADFESVREFVTSASISSLIDLPFLLVFLLTIAVIAGPLFLSPLIIMLVILLVSLLMSIKIKAAITRSYAASAQKNGLLIEALNAIESIKLFRQEGKQQRRWEQATADIATWSEKSRYLTQATGYFVSYATQLNTIIVVFFGVFLIYDNALSMGGLIATVILSGRAMAPMAQLSSLILRFHNAKVAYEGLDNIMQMPVERPSGKYYLARESFTGAFRCENLSFAFPEKEHAFINDLSIEIEAGDKLAVIGRIGSGKTTLMNLLTGLYEPSAGSVLIDGIDLRQIDPADLRRNIGVVTQIPQLLSGTIRDSIVAALPSATDEDILKAVERSGVGHFVNQDPEGLDRDIGEQGRFLSLGQRQTLAIARALLPDPPILIFDEPSSNLDKSSEKKLIDQLAVVGEGKTMIFLTHNLEMLKLANKVLVLDGGRVAMMGDKEEVLARLKGLGEQPNTQSDAGGEHI